MSRIVGLDGRPINQDKRIIIFAAIFNVQNGQVELGSNRQIIDKLPIDVRHKTALGMYKLIREDFKFLDNV